MHSNLGIVFDRNLSKMTSSLVGKFKGRRIDSIFVHKWVLSSWALKGSVVVLALIESFFCFSFSLKDYSFRISVLGPFFLRKHPL